MQRADVGIVVIGAGQAGLSAAYHLHRRGFTPASASAAIGKDGRGTGTAGSSPDGTFVVLDAEHSPGGAWQHRWRSLHMATVNGIHELPGHPVPAADPHAPAREVLPSYFAEYERRFDLRVRRPVAVSRVTRVDDDPSGRLLVETDAGAYAARYVVNATGTWRRPFWPGVPGTFAGRQLHVHDYVSADEFAGQRVAIVGAGISAVQLLDEVSRVADTLWLTRREVTWDADEFDTAARIAAIAGVEERVRQGLPPGSVISITGQHWSPWAQAARDRGVLVRHPMFTRLEPTGLRMPDGSLERVDAILWATGFRADLRHLAALGLRTPAGGLRVAAGRSIDEPRLFVIGYGPSQSTVGANRAGRDAARAIAADLAPA